MVLFNRCWHISTTPNTPKFFFIRSKLIQGSNMVILSCLAKKNQNLNARKKSSVYYWKGRFVGISGLKTHLSLINWTFFPRIQILIFHCEATQYDHIRSLYEFGTDKKKLGVLGVVDMRQLLLNRWNRTKFIVAFWPKSKILILYKTFWTGPK